MSELTDLKAELSAIKDNPYYPMYEGLLKQWNSLAQELKDGPQISINGEDKAFDRFAKFIEKLNALIDSIEKLRKKIGVEKEQETKKQDNPLEKRAR